MVFGKGNDYSGIIILGDSPGATEDKTGNCYSGRSGKFLRTMIKAAGFKESDIYMTYAAKCKPPGLKSPTLQELIACHSLLQPELDGRKYDIIIALGKLALDSIYGYDTNFKKFKGKLLIKGKTYIVPVYHPTYVLKNPEFLQEYIEQWKVIITYYKQFMPSHKTYFKKLKL